ncbi:DUF6279 family lipoprotein [Thiocapsa bogorovii]|uniref:DUF6279 family lipoprotein n=1 Tax=Thiocapsa bogorovii TaxID=521689 RepID=UPI001E4B0353|nr:DUF6279 family lipoprotein [Thiocapsa bogorovii]UHD16162.1 DUF6279 family lipoprotein [Thiocapsa bogorovii]
MPRISLPLRLAAAIVATALTIAGCSRVGIAYNTGDFLVTAYAKDYLDLEQAQLQRWEPLLEAELARHRAEELPYLAAYFDEALSASEAGFDATNMGCLTEGFRDLYKRQARFAVTLAAPLLAELTPAQIERLEQRFRKEAAEDRAEVAGRSSTREKEKRARRYVESIEDWTGPLSAEQQAIVAEVTGRMPDTQASLVEYRTGKRERLMALIRAKASEPEIARFLTDWLVEFDDLPADLEQGGRVLGERIGELFVSLGKTFDASQRDRLNKRLRNLRDDFMKLQKQPKMAQLTC